MPLFILTFSIMAMYMAVHFAQQQAAERRQLFDDFAVRSGGLLTSGESWLAGLPVVELEYRGLAATVRQTSTGGKHPVYYLESELNLGVLNRQRLRVEVYPEQFFSSLGKLMGMQDILIAVPRFDERYILKCNDPAQLRRLLDAPTRDALDSLYDLHQNNDVYLHVDQNKVLVKKRLFVKHRGEIDAIFEQALKLFDAALTVLDAGSLLSETPGVPAVRFLEASPRPGPGRGPQTTPRGVTAQGHPPEVEGIQFLTASPQAAPTTVCPVCGEQLAGHVNVACSQCEGRHHYDCWVFSGSCTTYGCSSTRCTEA